jgi:methylated-DNA-[protein]-cysteine S-methyltransferase
MSVTPDLDTRFRAAALAEGLVDVRYDVVDSPVGELLVAATDRGLCRVSYVVDDGESLVRTFGGRILRLPLDEVRRELDEYFAGARRAFEVPIDWSPLRGYTREVLRRTAEIPYGEARSYAEIADRAGSPRGWRATGNALGANPMPIVVPCHRVLTSSGRIGGYTGGVDRKRFLLALEGVEPDEARPEEGPPRRAPGPGR